MNQLSTTAMLCGLNISVYSGRKTDKKATAELRDWHGITEANAVKAGKRLLPEDAPTYQAITAIVTKARGDFYENTLPWLQSGDRILTSTNFMPLTEIMRQNETAFWLAVPNFIEEYPLLKARAKKVLNTLYREDDYPTVEKLKKRFSFEVKFLPLPDGDDFRVDLNQDHVEMIRKQIDHDVRNNLQLSMQEPYRRIFDGVAHMASRLQGLATCPCRNCKGKTFKTDRFDDSLVDNMIELCDVLPRLNLTGDPELITLIDQVKVALTPFPADSIRASDVLKESLAARAAAIQEQMAGLFSAVA